MRTVERAGCNLHLSNGNGSSGTGCLAVLPIVVAYGIAEVHLVYRVGHAYVGVVLTRRCAAAAIRCMRYTLPAGMHPTAQFGIVYKCRLRWQAL